MKGKGTRPSGPKPTLEQIREMYGDCRQENDDTEGEIMTSNSGWICSVCGGAIPAGTLVHVCSEAGPATVPAGVGKLEEISRKLDVTICLLGLAFRRGYIGQRPDDSISAAIAVVLEELSEEFGTSL